MNCQGFNISSRGIHSRSLHYRFEIQCIFSNGVVSETYKGYSESQHIQTRHGEGAPPIEEDWQPVVLTVNGKAELVVQDAESYQKILEAKERMEAIEGIKRGLESMKRNAGKPAEKFFQELLTEKGIAEPE